MKEMTIEEKAKLYDEAIERAKNYHSPETECNVRIAMENLFPVLKESEDEKIRKALIEAIRNNYTLTGYINHIPTKDILAWLEKQGEHADFRNTIQIGDKVTRNEDGVLVNLSQLKRVAKPADKVEPKIKAGDWVVCNNGPHHIFQVIERSWPNAKYRNINGTEIVLNVNTLDKQYHLWTIQDAKDGDVLADGDRAILLFRGVGNNRWSDVIDYYTLLETNRNNRFSLQEEDTYWGNVYNCSLYPATKEQRKLLFQKMKEAGYKWDAEKKELKKIVAPIFNIGDRVRYKEHACDGVITEITDTDYICGDAKLPISTQDKLELVEQNSDWSKEDEKNYDISLKIMCASNKSEELINKLYDWFKSLKNRVQSQTTWKPSDEQMEGLECTIKTLRYQLNAGDNRLDSLYNDLKKLKEE